MQLNATVPKRMKAASAGKLGGLALATDALTANLKKLGKLTPCDTEHLLSNFSIPMRALPDSKAMTTTHGLLGVLFDGSGDEAGQQSPMKNLELQADDILEAKAVILLWNYIAPT
ncbi:hypothetical protein E2P81_ATG02457 [Venturia nashicola]|nr:hypothetical protein E2P81_ATG02457 [Venturia nashicola]